jgi:hypothetical protein
LAAAAVLVFFADSRALRTAKIDRNEARFRTALGVATISLAPIPLISPMASVPRIGLMLIAGAAGVWAAWWYARHRAPAA